MTQFENKTYLPFLSVSINRKGVMDIDTVKGCSFGMGKYKNGCYGLCYAAKMAKLYGYDFSKSVSRKPLDSHRNNIATVVSKHTASWFRVGVMGEPCNNWDLTLDVCEWLSRFRAPVIITKHWIRLSDEQIEKLKSIGATVNTSISALDTEEELNDRIEQYRRLRESGINSVLRIVTVKFGNTSYGREKNEIQKNITAIDKFIDTPLRIPKSDERVECGDIVCQAVDDMNGHHSISVENKNTYIGICKNCPDQCGVNEPVEERERKWQGFLF